MLSGDLRAEPVVKVSHTVVWLAGALFAANVFWHLRVGSPHASQHRVGCSTFGAFQAPNGSTPCRSQ
jgi:hypothetical protein